MSSPAFAANGLLVATVPLRPRVTDLLEAYLKFGLLIIYKTYGLNLNTHALQRTLVFGLLSWYLPKFTFHKVNQNL